jgi:Tfp pilus assembly pilus retraction ATPase PilT
MYDIIQKRIKEAAIFESNLLEHKKKHMEEKRIVLHNILIESECIKNILTSSSVVLIDSCSNSNKESDESRESDEFNNKYDQKVFSEDELVNKSKLFYISFQNILNNKIRNGSL